MRKFVMLLFCLGLCLALVACSGQQPTVPGTEDVPVKEAEAKETGVAEEEYDVWYVTKTRSQAFSTWVVTVFEQTLAEKYPNIKLTTYDGEESFEVRAALMENAIAQQPDMLVLQYFDENEVPMIQDVIDSGVTVVVTNGQYTSAPDLCSFVDIDPYEQGATVAKYAAENIPQNAKAVLILGVAGNQHSVAREKAYYDHLFDVRDDIELLAVANADWDRGKAMDIMEDWIQAFDQIDVVITCYDEMSLGAMEALIAADRIEGVQIYGTDALPSACLAIKGGTYTATVLQDGYGIGMGAVKCVADYLINGNPGIQELYTETPLITADNVEDMIQTHLEFGLLTENDLK